jgi:hypothetical protein
MGVIEPGMQWAYPRESSCRVAMREAVNSYGLLKGEAKRLKGWLEKEFEENKKYESFLTKIDSTLIDADYIFVSDFFVEQYKGGAELSLDALIKKCEGKLLKLQSTDVNEKTIEKFKNKSWIFGNFCSLDKKLYDIFIREGVKYNIIEFDFKFCEYRLESLHEMLEGEPCDCMLKEHGDSIKKFFNGANKIFFMSEKQKQIIQERLNLNSNNGYVLSSVFDDHFFETVEKLQNQDSERSDKWVIISTRQWVKGSQDAIEWCNKNNKEFIKIDNFSYEKVLHILANNKGLCFLPAGHDTCPRLVIEAKLLGAEIHTNDNVMHLEEDWYNTDNLEDIKNYLKGRSEYFWKKINE